MAESVCQVCDSKSAHKRSRTQRHRDLVWESMEQVARVDALCTARALTRLRKSKGHLESVGGRDSCSKQRLNCEAVYNSRAVNKPMLISQAAP